MKLLIVPLIAALITLTNSSCKLSKPPVLLCDTTCLKDTIKFTGSHIAKPYLSISVKNCQPDSINWSYKGMGIIRKIDFAYLHKNAAINKTYIRCYFKDTAYAWLLFNDCTTKRGFQVRLPYDKKQNLSLISSGINNLDPKFSVSENLVVNTDRGNIYAEDMATGKKAMMTFGQKSDIDYDDIHEYIDSVNVTNSRIWVKVKIANDWKELEKKITLE